MKWSYNAVQKKGKALRNMLLGGNPVKIDDGNKVEQARNLVALYGVG